MKCPECGGELERDMVDVGVGELPSSPWGCPDCHWVEGAIDVEDLLDENEDKKDEASEE